MARTEISERPLIGIFGSQSACQVLLYLENYEKGYASEIARTFGISLNQVQNQLRKFEEAGAVCSVPVQQPASRRARRRIPSCTGFPCRAN